MINFNRMDNSRLQKNILSVQNQRTETSYEGRTDLSLIRRMYKKKTLSLNLYFLLTGWLKEKSDTLHEPRWKRRSNRGKLTTQAVDRDECVYIHKAQEDEVNCQGHFLPYKRSPRTSTCMIMGGCLHITRGVFSGQ